MRDQRGISPIVIVLIISVLIVGYLLLVKLTSVETSPQPTPQTLPSTGTSTQNPLTSSTKKCTDDLLNNNLGISFKCPIGFGFEISSADGSFNNQKSYIIQKSVDTPTGPANSFIYLSIIPKDFISQGGTINNYSTDATNILLSMSVGESKATQNTDDPQMALFWTYKRETDTSVNGVNAKVFTNNHPWEFPGGTIEKRLYIQNNDNTYLIGAFLGEDVSNELFNQFLSSVKFTN